MKAGTENRRKTIIAGAVASAALIYFIYFVYNAFFSGPSTAVPAPAPTVASTPAATKTTAVSSTNGKQNVQSGSVAGVAATKLATTSSSLDPTLDESAMLRTESLVYSGSGRNIFSGASEPPPIVIPKPVASARPVANLPPPPTTPQPYVPPPQPPIPLKFFGFEIPPNGTRQAFLLDGDTVVLANAGDIVRRRYHVLAIDAKSITVEDMLDNNKQKLPLSAN